MSGEPLDCPECEEPSTAAPNEAASERGIRLCENEGCGVNHFDKDGWFGKL